MPLEAAYAIAIAIFNHWSVCVPLRRSCFALVPWAVPNVLTDDDCCWIPSR